MTTKEKVVFDVTTSPYYKDSQFNVLEDYETEFWNIDETISELSYLTHNYFRYYGKFPSKVGKLIIEDRLNTGQIDVDKDFLFDNYEGSGTSLVEAKLKGIDSIGIDISPFAVLASNVKTYNFNVNILSNMWQEIKKEYHNIKDQLTNDEVNIFTEYYFNVRRNLREEFPDVDKWFREVVVEDLAVLKSVLLQLKYSKEREFFSLAFFAIIRRVSMAHDGEVRPHLNPKKRERDVFEAYSKKVDEMLLIMKDWNNATNNKVTSVSKNINNIDESNVREIISHTKTTLNKTLGLVISHPPYLNCFDYIPVYKLKFLWGFGFEEVYGSMDYQTIKSSEIKSYPVNNEKALEKYFEHNKAVYEIVYNQLRENGTLAIVIGDCTVKKKLLPVHKIFIKIMERIGFTVEKVVYRSTHYGLGKYAYNHKADYHGENAEKKEAILFFKK